MINILSLDFLIPLTFFVVYVGVIIAAGFAICFTIFYDEVGKPTKVLWIALTIIVTFVILWIMTPAVPDFAQALFSN